MPANSVPLMLYVHKHRGQCLFCGQDGHHQSEPSPASNTASVMAIKKTTRLVFDGGWHVSVRFEPWDRWHAMTVGPS